jgi:DNA-binding MarR family transcriptional regulator
MSTFKELFFMLLEYFENTLANILNHFVYLRNVKIKIFIIMSGKLEFTQEVQEIARFSKALSHPVRVYILQKLSKMDSCCYSGDLVEEIPVGRSTLSQHLKELKYAGLIQGEINPPYIKYCINRKNWEEAKNYLTSFLNQENVQEFSCDNYEKVNHK